MRDEKFAFIINPSKKKAELTEKKISEFFEKNSLSAPAFYYTEYDSPGAEQARKAIEENADIIVAVGGDGTARSVAHAVAETNKRFAIIPIGTANIFARNLDLNPKNLYQCLLNALAGHSKIYDIGFAKVKTDKEINWVGSTEQTFLAVAGIGFDAAMIASTSEKLKKRIGWLAYFSGSFKHIRNPRIKAKIDMLDFDGITHNIFEIEMRSLLFGNVSRIPGLTLIPPAKANDGKLDFVAIDTKANILGWGQLFSNIVMQSAGLKSKNTIKISNIKHRQGLSAKVKTDRDVFLQLDGDIVGKTRELKIELNPRALTVLVPDNNL
jgi:diacylglycerol kinase family enzyme